MYKSTVPQNTDRINEKLGWIEKVQYYFKKHDKTSLGANVYTEMFYLDVTASV